MRDIAGAAADKKAHNIVILNMKKALGVCNYFVISSGSSTTQVRAIADNIVDSLKEKGVRLWHGEGQREASWILLDYGDVVAHVFLEETRRMYDLERLWKGAPLEKFREGPLKTKKKIKRKAVRKAASKKTANKKLRKKKK